MKTPILLLLVVLGMLASCRAGRIVKITPHRVCLTAAGNHPAVFRYRGRNRIVNGLLVVYRGGYVTCNKNAGTRTRSRWGCGGKELNVVVTDSYNYLIYPRKEYIYHSTGLWYRLPGAHSKFSKSLLFSNTATPFHLVNRQMLKVWYGEDLKNWTESDNGGRVCVDVYAWII